MLQPRCSCIPSAHAALPTEPSEQHCAQAFDRRANAPVRAQLAGAKVGNVEIIPTGQPGCVIHFQLPAKHVVTASAAWRPGTDLSWTVTRKARGWVASTQGTWRGGRLTATDASATITRPLGPGPTISSCLATWNAAPPADLPSTAPAFVQALNGGITIDHKTGTRRRSPATPAP